MEFCYGNDNQKEKICSRFTMIHQDTATRSNGIAIKNCDIKKFLLIQEIEAEQKSINHNKDFPNDSIKFMLSPLSLLMFLFFER